MQFKVGWMVVVVFFDGGRVTEPMYQDVECTKRVLGRVILYCLWGLGVGGWGLGVGGWGLGDVIGVAGPSFHDVCLLLENVPR